jgi:Ser/Thr protein kinase RdoA (MazF antagonist)
MLHFTIPNFHNITIRLQDFFKALEEDPIKRAVKIENEIKKIKERSDEMKIVHQLEYEEKIPLRVTHNDTKFNNILFDFQDNIIGVIDLDTVMPGFVFSDFGDAIRTCTNTGSEDDQDLDRVTMDIKLYEAYAKGYIQETRHILTDTEIEYLAFSAKLLTFMQALRFLTDYLVGDIYYKIANPNHNLQRARTQFKLLQDMENKFAKMDKIINQIVQGQP